MRAWARRTTELHGELAAIAEIDPRWWLLAGGAAVAETASSHRATYVNSNAEPAGDTFIGIRAPEPADWIADAIARAHAARASLRELEGVLPDQPLAVTVDSGHTARTIPSTLEVAAFAIGNQVIRAQLATDIADEGPLAERLLSVVRGTGHAAPGTDPGHAVTDTAPGRDVPDAVPFVCVSIGDEPISTARHGHRRAWVEGSGPWLGLGHCGGLATVSTCHMVVDGYGHAWLASKIAEHHARLSQRGLRTTATTTDDLVADERSADHRRRDDRTRDHRTTHDRAPDDRTRDHRTPDKRTPDDRDDRDDRHPGERTAATRPLSAMPDTRRTMAVELPPLARVAGVIPLGVAWRELPSPAPRALPLAYALGCVLHRAAKRPGAKFSPTFQIPIAPGEHDDPERRLRRVVPSALSVRFERGEPEAFETFEARAREILTREAAGRGLCTRLLAAARAAPVSLAWKRKTFSSSRPRWLDRIAEVVGGRASLSRIWLDLRMPPACAVSGPARLASKADPLGSCVITILDDGLHASITACGSGALAGTPDDAADLIDALLDELRSEG